MRSLILLALLTLMVLPLGLATPALPSVIDGHVYTGGTMNTPPAVGVKVAVTCGDETDLDTTDSEGYFKVVFGIGDCPLGSKVEACAGDVCDTRELIGYSRRINLLGFKLFDVPEFSTVAAGVALFGASAGYLFLRRKH